jgi:aspartate aminotransferase-like enzyme
MATKLFIPGPINVSERVREVRAKHFPYGHRTSEVGKRLKPIFENAKKLFYISSDNYCILVSTSSGTGLMEGALRNCVKDDEKVLMVSIGAFGDLWRDIAKKNGKQLEYLSFTAGEPADANVIEDKLKAAQYAAICVTHSETSTGVYNSLDKISPLCQKYNTLFLVDGVSAVAGMPIKAEEWGIDVLLCSSQKCLGIDAGLALGAASPKALEKAAQVPNRGYYFDLLEFQKYAKDGQTLSTPNEVAIDELNAQLDYIINQEGLENRFNRHSSLAELVRKWALDHEFNLFSKRNHSDTVVCISNMKGIDLSALKSKMVEKGYAFDSGYRKLNQKLQEKGLPDTFRIPVMGDLTEPELNEYLSKLEEALA